MGGRPNLELREAIRAGYLAGESCASIAARVGSTTASIRVTAHKMGLRHPKHYPDASVRAKRDAEIRDLIRQGVKHLAIAMQFGLTESRVSGIGRGINVAVEK